MHLIYEWRCSMKSNTVSCVKEGILFMNVVIKITPLKKHLLFMNERLVKKRIAMNCFKEGFYFWMKLQQEK